ncbi:MAG TPA: hypothetical protein QF846_09435 [Acidimicrobiales bacterium]|nr:hypothetical protein [Acidimicrobiales bacterium]
MAKRIFVALVLAITSCGATEIENGANLGRHPSFATTTSIDPLSPTSTTQVATSTSTSTSAAIEVLIGPATLSPDGQVEEVSLPEGVIASTSGVYGQIRATAFGPQGDFGWGLSYYTALWGSFPSLPPHGLLTASGTWLIPDNWRYPETLCPEGTTARDSLTERGPSYRDVFQTIEGGVGHWEQSRFPSTHPKFRLVGNTDCYTTDTSNPGWAWSNQEEMVPGLIQLSNRIVVPPDGITFKPNDGALLGAAWLALPLSEPYERDGLVVGDKSWTLFLESANFRGPVAYWTPEAWSRITADHPPSQFRGLDHRPIDTEYRVFAGHLDLPSLHTNEEGDNWFRIPHLKFPVDEQGRTIFHQDVTFYGPNAIYNQMKGAVSGAPLPLQLDDAALMHAPLQTHRWELQSDGREITGLEKFVMLDDWDTDQKEGWAWGLQWSDPSGVFPTHYRKFNNEWEATDGTGSPSQLNSTEARFPSAARKTGYAPSLEDGPEPQVREVQLNDGSVLRYTWYRFVDQPALAALGLTTKQKTDLQAIVERIHTQWGQQTEFIKPPSQGDLVELQQEVLVQPPTGAEVGWVPVVISQTAAK